MRKFILLLFLIVFDISVSDADAPRKPFVVLRVNGKEYTQNENIKVRPGERLIVEVVLLGGRRDYCSNPQKYANVGKTTVITSKGEDGMSFYIGNGTFRGTWSLVEETATLSGGAGVKIKKEAQQGNKKNKFTVEIPQSGYSQVYVKAQVSTKWHYLRHTQAGSSEKDETNSGSATFYFTIQAEEGVWYSSANLTCKGNDNFSVRNDLDDIQKYYDEIQHQIEEKNFGSIETYINNLKSAISNLKTTIDREKSKNPSFMCEVTFLGLPTTKAMNDLKSFETLSLKWKELFLISQENVSKINDMLLKVRTGLSANILKSVFKNYINWGTSIPTSAPDFLTVYDPNSTLSAVALPGKVLGWWQDANNDASILQNQFQTIKMLSQLQKFYMDRMNKSVEERKQIQKVIKELDPVKNIDNQLRNYFSTITWAKVVY